MVVALAGLDPALAADECGIGAAVICTSADPAYPTYPGSIIYDNAPTGQSVTFGPGVAVNTMTANIAGLSVLNSSGPVVIDTVSGTITTSGPDAFGIWSTTTPTTIGGISITTGDVTTSGSTAGAVRSLAWSGPMLTDTRAGTITTFGVQSIGIQAQAFDGSLAIWTADVSTSGTQSVGVLGVNFSAADTIIDTTAGSITTGGFGAFGVNGAVGDGDLNIRTGNVVTSGDSSVAVAGSAVGVGAATIDTRAGAITTLGAGAHGLIGEATGNALTMLTADVTTSGTFAVGVAGLNSGAGPTLIDTTAGSIATAGDNAAGVFADNFQVGAISIVTGRVTTQGAAAPGISSFGDGAVTIDTTAGPVNTAGAGSAGIFTMSALPIAVTTITTGAIGTTGPGAFGVAAAAWGTSPTAASGVVSVTNRGPIIASGADAGGIVAASYASAGNASGPVTVDAQANITASGQNSVGISATSSTGSVAVDVASGVSVMGGWSANPGDLSTQAASFFEGASIGANLPAAGIVVFGGAPSGAPAMTITNQGVIGALNDRAITMGSPCSVIPTSTTTSTTSLEWDKAPGFLGYVERFAAIVSDAIVPSAHAAAPVDNPCLPGGLPPVGALQVTNTGTVLGYVTLWDGAAHSFNNAGLFDVRNFADSDGDGVRDTKSVSVSDFGGPNATFSNLTNGVVRMAPVTSNAITDTTGEYVPTTGTDSRSLESSFYSIARPGVVQGQFVNLQSFDNAGIIDLRGSEVGNTLVMTSNSTVGGTPGTGVFVSNGGQLLLNTVLNDGIPSGGQTNSYSDMLIVDQTQLGAGGSTAISVSNVGGAGALTPGNGIELVEVRNKTASDPGAFTLAGDYVTKDGQQAVVGGAYAYTLFHNGVGSDNTDGNWYLRSQLIPTDPDTPRENPGVPLYEAYPQHLLALNTVPTLQQRVGNRYWKEPAPAPKTVFCKDASQNFRCPVTAEQAKYYADGPASIEDKAIWARIEGARRQVDPTVTTSGNSYGTDVWRLQAGFDGLLSEAEDGSKLIGGITVHYGQASSDVTSIHGDGRIDSDGYGFGGTLTWLDQNGFYVDGQASLTWFDSDLFSDTAGRSLVDGNDGFGHALSVEAGRVIDLNDSWTLTPQAQLAYASVDFDDFTDVFGATVSRRDGDSLIGRLGLSADRNQSWKDGDGKARRSHLYGITNLFYEFLDASEVAVSGTNFVTRPERLWGGVGVGGTYNWNDDKYSVYGEVSVNTSLASFADSYALGGTAGFRVRW